MGSTSRTWIRALLAVAAIGTSLTACSADDAALGPSSTAGFATTFDRPAAETARAPELGSCDSLAAPAGASLAARLYAEGDQIYRWSGTSWTFVAPSAVLYPNQHATAKIGIHYAGPTGETVSGSKVVGAVLKRCPGGAGAIPWLLLQVTSEEGSGLFHGVTLIQRINTVGGIAPAAAGAFVGEESRVPYTTEYLFYRGT